MTDSSRMDRIENMIETVRFLPESDFCSAEKFLKEKLTDKSARPRAALILAELYVKRAREYDALAAPLARQALLLNPDEKRPIAPFLMLNTAPIRTGTPPILWS